MCFDNYLGQDRVKIATEDIPTFKGLIINSRGEIVSPVKTSTRWKIGKLKRVWFMQKKGSPDSIEKGIHSAKTADRAEQYGPVYNAVIPRGSVYWENGYEYVSNKIIIVSKV